MCHNGAKQKDVFREGRLKPLKFQRFQDVQLLSFQQNIHKTRSFFSGFQASEPAAPLATGVQENRRPMKFSI